MQITLDTKPFASLETDALVTYLFENGDLTQGRPAELDKLTGGMLTRLSKSGSTHPPASKPRACSSSGQGSASNLTPLPFVKLLVQPCAI
jgi:hypothetical protein